jgi:hypothetical protein
MLAMSVVGWQHLAMRDLAVPLLFLVMGLAACPVAVDGGFDGAVDGFDGFVGFDEVTTSRSMAIALVAPHLEQRFQVPITISRPSPDARVRARFVRVDGVVVGELTTDAFANPSPSNWALLQPGAVLTTFSAAIAEEETFRLSLATNSPPAAVEVELSVTAPADVDFDGLDDGVSVEIGAPRPFIP